MGGSAPKSDPKIGEAALLSASTGREMLDWMRGQARTTNNWATQDRARYINTFQPIENQLIRDANNYDSPQRKQLEANRAAADVRQQATVAEAAMNRQLASMGVSPNSKRFVSDKRRSAISTALGAAGARNMARRQVDATADTMRANVVNLGKGLAVNPLSSIQASNGAMSAGGNAAMSGYQQQGNLLNTQYQNQLQAWQSNQSALGSIGGAAGQLAGAFLFGSSKKLKENITDVDALGAVRKMPVKGWKYKDGVADGGNHVGPIAEDFQKATGVGDGKTIDMISAIGVTMGAVQQLADKVDALGARRKSP